MSMMKAARLHQVGKTFQIDSIEVPTPGVHDVLVEVKACNLVPNLRNVIESYPTWFPYLPLPKLPVIYGLDAAGIVKAVGPHVHGIKVGDRVYVNPGRSCGSCHACLRGQHINCTAYTFQGYFGFGPGSQEVFEEYPYGGLCQYMTAPSSGLVKLPEAISFEQGCRFGYLGTAYSALRKAGVCSGQSVLISGATGTLGLGAVLLALAMGATKIFALARNRQLLERVRAIAPDRIFTLSHGDQPLGDWVREHTEELGADVFIDAVGPGAPHTITVEAIGALRRGGRMVDIGGMSEDLPVPMFKLMCFQISVIGSLWFTVAEGQDMAEMAAAGTLDLSVFDQEVFPIEQVNQAMDSLEDRKGGFTNVVIDPSLV
ncbi:alcohol dehydrogenase catalytic domain-containing protein [Pseudomonas sp. Marseille-P9899]|uniref:alcohol dehydrogenase catalytic domain-containing protein n=1 Tax=Pseudomonas sp. Marseille-P9899 TaxID=2730401 RepID=UPI00158D5859|nr:alcohol dehydrogenase catalytic domain-containing protein [Pseudomonas sp. Marseille-P9899]